MAYYFPIFIHRMYPGDSSESRMRRQEHLLDLYLNTRKKGDCDTPLHQVSITSLFCYYLEMLLSVNKYFLQAAKYGHYDVVKLLTDYSSCDTKCLNKDELTPAEVVCSRQV